MDILRMVIALLIYTMIMKVVFNVINCCGIDFVGFIEDVLKKVKKTR